MSALSHPQALAWLRTLVWVIALVLPLQAQARVLMLSCASSHAAMQTLQQSSQGSQGAHDMHAMHHEATDVASHSSPGHDHQAMLQAAALAGDGHGSDDSSTPSHACSSGCADCCVAAVMPSVAVMAQAPTGHGLRSSAPEPASLAVVPGGLERPPKATFLAFSLLA